MKTYSGKSVLEGIAMGKIRVYREDGYRVRRVNTEDTEQEIQIYVNAREKAVAYLQNLYEKVKKEAGDANASVFKIHEMILKSEDYNQAVLDIIREEKVNAAYAVDLTGKKLFKMFSSLENEYMRSRAADMRDISDGMLKILCREDKKTEQELGESAILVADDLTPSQTVHMDKEKVLALVTAHGSVNSHAAILARTMGIPALVDTELPDYEELDGRFAIVDGQKGLLYLDPDEKTIQTMAGKMKAEQEKKALLQALRGKESITGSGKKILLGANIGSVEDLQKAIGNDAEGIGLFRSEMLYLENEDYPSEEEQFRIYRIVTQTMGNRPVVIRTLDIGADKVCAYLNMEPEENPALGCRAIRICLERPEMFKTQLRAIFRAAVYGNLSILYPMITSLWELEKIQSFIEEIRKDLDREGISYKIPRQGIMIETPAAAVLSRQLAEKVDFFSIGTNDLTQYTLAADRQNPKLDKFYDPCHPAVLKMIHMTIEHAHEAGIPVCICGEAAGDPDMVRRFLQMGVDELSVSPGRILPVRKIILETDRE